MDQFYLLMRKNEEIARLSINEAGAITKFSRNISNLEIAPLQYQYETQWLQKWWRDRSVPITQGRIQEFLRHQGYSVPSEYLQKNLGLSLTDYYWIKPVESALTWERVNLFDNDFRENLMFGTDEQTGEGIPHYSPNSSLQGDIEKSWVIMGDQRCLVKGNRNNLSSESINELIACKVHQALGYDNYTQYYPIQIRDKEYDLGCYSAAFTSQTREFIPAYAIYTYRKKPNGVSPYRHFVNLCEELGMDTVSLQADLDYQFMTDFVISEYDRHLNNFGIIRNADTLKLERLAPIFDSGGCLFVNKGKPRNEKDLLKIKTNGFAGTEMKMLEYVQDKNVIDLTKLPPSSAIRELYAMDSQISEKDINNIGYWYEKKIEMARAVQLGRDPLKLQYAAADMNRDQAAVEAAERELDSIDRKLSYVRTGVHFVKLSEEGLLSGAGDFDTEALEKRRNELLSQYERLRLYSASNRHTEAESTTVTEPK